MLVSFIHAPFQQKNLHISEQYQGSDDVKNFNE
jgi:hypothetical protein